MKSLITAAASLMLLLAFLVQFTHSQMLHSRLFRADETVYTFREIVRQEGCVSSENEEELKKALAEIFRCSLGEITVSGGRTPVFRGQTIDYQISLPVKEAVALGSFWGIGGEENEFTYQVRQTVASEYTGREP